MNSLLYLAFGPTLFSCSGSSPVGLPDPDTRKKHEDIGSLDLNLVTPEGVTVSIVDYRVTSVAGAVVAEDEIDVRTQDSGFSFFLRLPADNNYQLDVLAEGEMDGEVVPCTGTAPFNIVDGAVTQVALDVVCTIQGKPVRPAAGAAQVTATISVEQEPSLCGIANLTVGPLVVYVGEAIAVRGTAQPDTATLHWSTAGGLTGEFSDPESTSGASGTFTCGGGQGQIVLQIAANDCTDEARVPVTCVESSDCGDGVRSGIEECDDGNNVALDGCGPSCTLEACGDGVVQPGEACDDGNGTGGDGCSSTCSIEVCGNGLLEGSESCDDANLTPGDGCSSTCRLEVCGDGVIHAALGEQCDDSNLVDGDGCSSSCQLEDADSDGIADELDQCAQTSTTPVGVDGCSLDQRCRCDDAWMNHGQFVSCVANVLDIMFANEIITSEERGSLQSAAAMSSCGK